MRKNRVIRVECRRGSELIVIEREFLNDEVIFVANDIAYNMIEDNKQYHTMLHGGNRYHIRVIMNGIVMLSKFNKSIGLKGAKAKAHIKGVAKSTHKSWVHYHANQKKKVEKYLISTNK